MLGHFSTAFVVYFVVIDPIGNSPIFFGHHSAFIKMPKIQSALEHSILWHGDHAIFALCGA